jgi:hippurate hydrolase
MATAIRDDAVSISGEIAELRHSIHAEPEIGLELPRTQQKVLAALSGLPLEITTGQALSSVTAVLRGGQPGPTVLLRGDMDALPVTERTGLSYSSRIPEAMHACGHDLHTSMLAGAAKLLASRQADLPGNVIFMFQPGEESVGGAKIMIDEGVLDAAGERPVAAYALHVTSGLLPLGVTASKAGAVMAAADKLQVTVRGRGGHGAQPHFAADPIPVACEIVMALQSLVTRKFDIFDPVVITVGTFHSGTVDNVIPDNADFVATVRSFSAAARDRVRETSVQLARQIAEAHGLHADVTYEDVYPVTSNDTGEFTFAQETVGDLFGPQRFLAAPNPITGSEDFSYVLEEVPGAFMMIGACPPDRNALTAPFNHSAEAVFDDAIIPDGMTIYAELALRRLAAGA